MACALLCAVAGDNGAGMTAAAQGGALARDGGIAGRGAGVGRRVVAWRWRGVGRGLWRARCFALLQVTAGRAWPQRRRAGHWHGTGASQGRALSLARGGDGANESSSAGRAGQGTGAGRGGGVVRGCGRAPVPLVFRAARWRRGGRGQSRYYIYIYSIDISEGKCNKVRTTPRHYPSAACRTSSWVSYLRVSPLMYS